MSLLAVLFTVLGLALTAGMIAVTGDFLWDERGILETQESIRRIAFAISRRNFPTRTSGQRQYENDVGALPTSLTDLLNKPGAVAACSLDAANQAVTGWCGPYLIPTFQGENLFADGWGKALVYSSAARTITSWGPNRASGGGDDLTQGF